MRQNIKQIVDEVKKVVVGKEDVTKKLLMTILAGGHVLLEDIPGVGKTTLALAFSKVLGLDFNRTQFTPDVVASDIIGFTTYDKNKDAFVFKQGAVMCNLYLGDEINRTTSRTQSALLEVMEEKSVTVDGHTYTLPAPFHVIATQNPIGSHGTQMLPQSQMDRFMLKTSIGYPDFNSQVTLLKDRQMSQPLYEAATVVSKEELLGMQQEVSDIYVSDEILQYITSLTEETRNHESIAQGISPRGALALSRIAKARAYLADRNFVIPEDVLDMFIDTSSHRIILQPKARIKENSAQIILQEIMQSVPTPEQQTAALNQ